MFARCGVRISRSPSSPFRRLISFSTSQHARTEHEIGLVNDLLMQSVASNHPVMHRAANYLFSPAARGKQFRPRLVLTIGRLAGASAVDRQTLAAITEIIHSASLIHDDVIDEADTRRSMACLHKVEDCTRLAVLAGDFLLARASRMLASLRTPRVVSMLSETLEHLTLGECIQMGVIDNMPTYLEKTFYKTASLLANASRAAVVLAESKACKTASGASMDENCASPSFKLPFALSKDEHSGSVLAESFESENEEAAYMYGKHVGISFQLIDDVLDYTQSSAIVGKPSEGADLRQGLATAPVLFAAQEHKNRDLWDAIRRRFGAIGDVELALNSVKNSKGVEQSRDLAAWHAEEALKAARRITAVSSGDSSVEDERTALEYAAMQLLKRTR
ncbi:mitochondrial ubiquinone biosynthesis Coq1 (hexaprenyl pyrophosphate synthetase) [Andalucia godoyi]|uniref:Mitochondrial ubiquinone biosynthesis Coq1 (Hexaprenyl pyrophosphate synthetase) n=1 Tax=Andalucia godoyi TaxID=505711 RepID=A0A8K0AIC9_ANDGO|nr:mitochondrial ubiquinone biosynthesis Coq1 (hexaprenyl pyrophosphate synthetase) [Andalucia godoyi]|eukprot:ANDGO_00524.mRNA.1 mitochondrial ubiquinone biosynthesis Coq1 (hexaprenyl pyrophosphate synthetase)